MSEVASKTFIEGERRIRFRQDLMSIPGGTAYLVKMGGLFGLTDKALGPGSWGMPDTLARSMHAKGW